MDPYAPQPKCLCGDPFYVHDLRREAGQLVRKKCSASLCGCSRYRSPDAPVETRCPTCGTPWDPIEAARLPAARFVPDAAVVDWPRPVVDVHLPEETP